MKTAYSCVVDAQPKLEWQAFLWMHSLVENAGCAARHLKVHHVPGVTDYFLNAARDFGVTLVPLQPFAGGHGFSNKIEQCFSAAFQGYEKVVLCDCDLFFLSPPRLPKNATFAGKIVDLPNPSIDLLRAIYDQAGITAPAEIRVDCALSANETTLRGNCNGGFYALDPRLLSRLGDAWRKHALWLLARREIFGDYWAHVDQAAMALALSELRVDCTLLTAESNFPVHLPAERLKTLDATRIDVLHYHSSVLPSGQIKTTGIAAIDAAIGRANQSIAALVDRNFHNALFWNNRYASFPELGSGVGSRGEVLSQKKELLRHAVTLFEAKTVMDIGCGDLEVAKDFRFCGYVGWDLSAVAVEIARQKRPDWRFEQGDLWRRETKPQADLVLCLDVLIHQKKKEDYLALVADLSRATRERLIVSGYEREPELSSNIIAFHEPLSDTLKRLGAFTQAWEIGGYRDVSLLVADKTPAGAALHHNDIAPEVFSAVIPLVERRDILCEVVDWSRQSLGFFTKTASRALEYPWVVEKLQALPARANILDIGAGVSPVPIVMSRRGLRVTSLDNHPLVRSVGKRSEWNEWGFLDYRQIGVQLNSAHTDVLEFAPLSRFAAIYSISVIEHMPRKLWERTLELTAQWLEPGGLLLLTIDLISGTSELWTKSEGQVVDPDGVHGNLADVEEKLRGLGYVIKECFVKRAIPSSRTDVAFVSAIST